MIMDLNAKSILISVFQLAEQGELTNLEQKEIINALHTYGISKINNQIGDDTNNLEEINIQDEFKRIRLGCRSILEQTEKCIDTALKMLKEYQINIEKMRAEIGKLPKFAQYGDSIELIKLIKSMDKDLYNFSEAEKLVNTSRQTLKKHAIIQKDGLRIFQSGKSEYLTREGLIQYYRAKLKDDSLPF